MMHVTRREALRALRSIWICLLIAANSLVIGELLDKVTHVSTEFACFVVLVLALNIVHIWTE